MPNTENRGLGAFIPLVLASSHSVGPGMLARRGDGIMGSPQSSHTCPLLVTVSFNLERERVVVTESVTVNENIYRICK